MSSTVRVLSVVGLTLSLTDLRSSGPAGLSEWYSPAAPGTGLHPRPASASALRTYFPEIDHSWESIYYPSRKGEDIPEVHDRTRELMRALVPAVEERFGGEHKRILLVTHAATVIALTRELVGDRDLPLRVGCCTLTNLERPQGVRDAVGCWQPKKLADGGHLKDGVTRDWGFDNCIIIDGKVSGIHLGEIIEGADDASGYRSSWRARL